MSLKEFSQASGQAVEDASQVGDSADAGEEFAHLPLEKIVTSRTNPRQHFDEAKLTELASSIRASGVHQPILVRPLPADRLEETSKPAFNPRAAWPFPKDEDYVRPTHEIVAGERRYRASQRAGKATIPAMVRRLTDAQVLEIQLVENLQRDDLTELEEAEGYERLINETGLAKEDIAEKIGKSRSYVYARLKLLDLGQEGRKALQEGKLDFSRALLVARIPDPTLQIKTLKELTATNHDGELRMGVRAAQLWVRQNVMVPLKDARFNAGDANLCPDAGACTHCPKRTGANPDLFTETVGGPDLCTDPHCFDTKHQAHSQQLIDKARNKGMEVIEGKEALELKPHSHRDWIDGYTRLDEPVDVGGKESPLRDQVDKKDLKGAVKLFIDPHTKQAIEVVSDDFVAKLERARQSPEQKKVAQKLAKEQAAHLAAQREEQAIIDYETAWRRAAIAEIRPRVASGEVNTLHPAVMRAIFDEMIGAMRVDHGHLAEALACTEDYDEEQIVEALDALPDDQVGTTLLLTLLHSERHIGYDWNNGRRTVDRTPPPVITCLAEQLSINLAAIQAGVQTQLRAALSPKPLAAPEEGAGGRKKKGSGGKGRTSAAEAQQGIAAALQAAEDGIEGEESTSGGADAPQGNDAATPVADEPGGAITVGTRVEVTDKVTQKQLLSSIGLQGEVTGRSGEAWMVNLRTKQRKRVLRSFMPEELKVLQ
jgi:ParB/RepB/Spo0J family partition protein